MTNLLKHILILGSPCSYTSKIMPVLNEFWVQFSQDRSIAHHTVRSLVCPFTAAIAVVAGCSHMDRIDSRMLSTSVASVPADLGRAIEEMRFDPAERHICSVVLSLGSDEAWLIDRYVVPGRVICQEYSFDHSSRISLPRELYSNSRPAIIDSYNRLYTSLARKYQGDVLELFTNDSSLYWTIVPGEGLYSVTDTLLGIDRLHRVVSAMASETDEFATDNDLAIFFKRQSAPDWWIEFSIELFDAFAERSQAP